MDNIANTVKEKMKKVYSFTGTQLLVTGLWVVILLSIVAGTGRGHMKMNMKNNMVRWSRQEIMKQYDRQWSNREQKQVMMRWKAEHVMNWNQNNQPTANQEQVIAPSSTTDSGN